jgi:hypothetical protein
VDQNDASPAIVEQQAAAGTILALVGGDTDGPGVELEGDPAVLAALTSVLTAGDPAFDIIVP